MRGGYFGVKPGPRSAFEWGSCQVDSSWRLTHGAQAQLAGQEVVSSSPVERRNGLSQNVIFERERRLISG
jgi:hypothetical protein